jgi:hypothetical protein
LIRTVCCPAWSGTARVAVGAVNRRLVSWTEPLSRSHACQPAKYVSFSKPRRLIERHVDEDFLGAYEVIAAGCRRQRQPGLGPGTPASSMSVARIDLFLSASS